jgi:hypothetical protein
MNNPSDMEKQTEETEAEAFKRYTTYLQSLLRTKTLETTYMVL